MAYRLFYSTKPIFWTENSEWKPSYSFMLDWEINAWTEIDKCSINFETNFTGTIVLPKKINNQIVKYTYLKVLDTENDFIRYYILKSTDMEMERGKLYTVILDVWTTYCLKFIHNTSTSDYPINVERFLNNRIYRNYYLKGNWNQDDEFINMDNYEWSIATSYTNSLSWAYQNDKGGDAGVTLLRTFNLVNDGEDNKCFSQLQSSDYQQKHFNMLIFNEMRCSLVVYQLSKGNYVCFITPDYALNNTDSKNDNYFELMRNDGNVNANEYLKKNWTITSTLIEYFNTAYRNGYQEVTQFANKLVGCYALPPWFSLFPSSQTPDNGKERLYHNLTIQTFKLKHIYTNEIKNINTLYFEIKPEDFISLQEIFGLNKYFCLSSGGWYPHTSIPISFINGYNPSLYSSLDNERLINTYENMFWVSTYHILPENHIAFANFNCIINPYSTIYSMDTYGPNSDQLPIPLNRYALSKCKYSGHYLPPVNTMKKSNSTSRYSPYKIKYDSIGFGGNGIVSFSGNNWWFTNSWYNADIVNLYGTSNISQDSYIQFLQRSKSQMNTNLQIANDKSNIEQKMAILNGLERSINAVDSVKWYDPVSWGTGPSKGIIGVGKSIIEHEQALNIYKHKNIQLNAKLVDEKNSATAININSNDLKDDFFNKIIKDVSNNSKLGYINIYSLSLWYKTGSNFSLSDIREGGPNKKYSFNWLTKTPSNENDILFLNKLTWNVGVKGNFFVPIREVFFNWEKQFKYYYDKTELGPKFFQNKFVYAKTQIPIEIIKKFIGDIVKIEDELYAITSIFDSGVRIWDYEPTYDNFDSFILVDDEIITDVNLINEHYDYLNDIGRFDIAKFKKLNGVKNEPTTETCEPQDEPNNNQSSSRVRKIKRQTKKTKRDDKK